MIEKCSSHNCNKRIKNAYYGDFKDIDLKFCSQECLDFYNENIEKAGEQMDKIINNINEFNEGVDMNDTIKEWLNDNLDELVEIIGTRYNNNFIQYGKKQSKIKEKLKQKGWLPMDALEEARKYYKNSSILSIGMQKITELYEKAIFQLQNEIKELKELK